MTLRSIRYSVAYLVVLAAGVMLFLRDSPVPEALRSISVLYLIAPLVVAAMAVYPKTAAGRQARWTFFGSALLILLATWLLLISDNDKLSLEKKWRRADTELIKTTLRTIGEKIHELANYSDYIGHETRQYLLAGHVSAKQDTLDFTLEAFKVLQRLAQEMADSGLLPAGTEIGIQLLDPNQRRIAWAGWPQPLTQNDRARLDKTEEVLFTRQVSLYRILTRIIPIQDDSGLSMGWVVIDTPVEVNYKVNNKYLKSTSLAEKMAAGLPVNIKFDYQSAVGGAADRSRRRAEEPPDSIRAAFQFPDYITPLTPIMGDQSLGLSARARVDDNRGEPILYVTVHGRPFSYFSNNFAIRYQLLAKLCLTAVLILIFVYFTARFPRRIAGPLESVRFAFFIGMFVALRFALLSLPRLTSTEELRIFDPAIFATPALKGMMRSAGDLLITALFLVVALYVILKITRNRLDQSKRSQFYEPSAVSVMKGFFAGTALVSVIELLRKFISMVVVNANPRLLGETMKVFEPEVLVLHLSIFLMVSGVILAGLLCIWGAMRIKGTGRSGRIGLIALVPILSAILLGWHWTYATLAILLVLFLIFAPRFARREDLVSIVIVSFTFVVITSSAAYIFLNDEYQNLRKSFIQEKAEELSQPFDTWRVFLLEAIMGEYANNPEIQQALHQGDPESIRRLAFDLWAGSPLSLLGYSTAVYVLSPGDSILAQFSVDMPFRMKPEDETERTDTERAEEWVVLDLTRRTPQGNRQHRASRRLE
jgi:hypothetical protein